MQVFLSAAAGCHISRKHHLGHSSGVLPGLRCGNWKTTTVLAHTSASEVFQRHLQPFTPGRSCNTKTYDESIRLASHQVRHPGLGSLLCPLSTGESASVPCAPNQDLSSTRCKVRQGAFASGRTSPTIAGTSLPSYLH
ncbi:unnamed protein product [Ixodes persulcatus]